MDALHATALDLSKAVMGACALMDGFSFEGVEPPDRETAAAALETARAAWAEFKAAGMEQVEWLK